MSNKPSIAKQITASMSEVLGALDARRAAPDVSALEMEVARLNNEMLAFAARLAALEARSD